MDIGLGLLGHRGAAADVAFAEQHGITTAGFVDSPLLGGDPFVGLALAAAATSSIRLGTFLAVPGNRTAATTATAIASINALAPGRTFLGIGTGYTSRNTFGLRPVPVGEYAEFARVCRALLDGEAAYIANGDANAEYLLSHEPDLYIATEPRIPVYLAGDGPKALEAVGRFGDGWISTMQFSHMMQNSHDVFAASLRAVQEAGERDAARYTIVSTALGILRDGETPTSPRMLALVGPMAMLPFHSYADNPAIADYLPPIIQERLDIYEREVLAKFPVTPDRRHQWTHRGHLAFLQPGEEKVLTDEIVQMTTLTGSLDEVVSVLGRLSSAGLSNLSTWVPPHLVRETVLDIEDRLLPHLATTSTI